MMTKGGTSQRTANRRAQSAFTLVELLVVVAIMSLALGALLPTLKGFFDSARLPDARNLISASLPGARNYAVANTVTTALIFEEDDGGGRAMRTSIFFAEQSDLSNGVLEVTPVAGRKSTHLPDNIIVSANQDGDSGFPDRTVGVCFSPTGQLIQLDDSVTDFYLYDFTNSNNPEELDRLYINYYTGAVIKQ